MIHLLFSIRDSAAEAYSQPFCAPSVQVAMRSVRDMVNDPGKSTLVAKNPEDFELYQIASFDDSNGVLEGPGYPSVVARCRDLVKVTQ